MDTIIKSIRCRKYIKIEINSILNYCNTASYTQIQYTPTEVSASFVELTNIP